MGKKKHGGFQLVMGVPLYRWMLYFHGKIRHLEMDDDLGGSPPILGNPPIVVLKYVEICWHVRNMEIA